MARLKSISKIVEEAAQQPTMEGKVWVLRSHDHNVLRQLLRMAVDPNVPWTVPEGNVPFKPCEFEGQENMLYKEAGRISRIFLRGEYDHLKDAKRQQLFIQTLECLDSQDARFVVDVRNHKLPPGIDINVIRAAWPGII